MIQYIMTPLRAYYFVDEKYHILDASPNAIKFYPGLRIGDICYKAFCGLDEPCEDCGLRSDKEKRVFYNKILDKYLEIYTVPVRKPDGELVYLVHIEHIEAENHHLLLDMFKMSTYDMLYEIDLSDLSVHIISKNTNIYTHTLPEDSMKLEELTASRYNSYVYPADLDNYHEFWNMERLLGKLRKEGKEQKCYYRRRLATGGWGWVLLTVVLVRHADEEYKLICMVQSLQDAMEMVAASDENAADDFKNFVPRLFKESSFYVFARECIGRVQDKEYCMVSLDIEHFKLFNEFYGVDAGDQCLTYIGGMLTELAEENGGVAGHISSDDFAVLIPHKLELVKKIEKKILSYMNSIESNAGFFPTIGIYVITDKNVSVSKMYDCAELAMNSVKGQFDKRVAYYTPAMLEKMEEEHWLLSAFVKALKEETITFHLQPKCNVLTGKIVGIEMLVRWRDAERGNISPGKFVPVLEKNGLICKLDTYMWEQSMRGMRRWRDDGCPLVPTALNISRVDFYTMDVVETLTRLAKKYGIEHELIEVEITESAFQEDHQEDHGVIYGAIRNLRERGFTVSIDDFGSGYSSLNMLKDVDADILKIDMKFLQLTEENREKGTNILHTIMQMAAATRHKVVVEGVETEEQLELIKSIGCTYVQGYYLYRPMAEEAYRDIVAQGDIVDCKDYLQKSAKPEINLEEFQLEEDFFKDREFMGLEAIVENQLSESLKMNKFILACAKILHRNSDITESLNLVLEKIGQMIQSERAYILETDGVTVSNTFEWCAQGITPQINILQNLPYDLVEPWEHYVHKDGFVLIPEVENIKDEDPDTYDILRQQDIDRLAATPIYENGKIVGYLGVDNYKKVMSSFYIHYVLETITFFMTSELKNHRLMEKLEYQSYMDSLTKTYNRNAFTKEMARYEEADRTSLGVVFMDINGMKSINDKQGHAKGDEILAQIVDVLKKLVAPHPVYRVGGDEFVVFYPDIDKKTFEAQAKALSETLHHEKYVQMAIGEAWGDDSRRYQQILNEADEKMYQDKDIFYRMNKKTY